MAAPERSTYPAPSAKRSNAVALIMLLRGVIGCGGTAGSGYFSAMPWNDLNVAIAVLLPLISGFLPEQLHHLAG